MTEAQIQEMQLKRIEGMADSQERVCRMNEAEATFKAQAAKTNADREVEITEASRATHKKLSQQTDNLLRPTSMLRPEVKQVEGEWLATFSEVVGNGPSPELACQDFDRRWLGKDEI